MKKYILLVFIVLVSISLFSDLDYRPKTILAENATATWCGYCPDAYAGLDVCHAAYDYSEFLSIRYYATSGNYGTVEIDAAIAYYEVTGFPTTVFEGVDRLVGGGESIATGTPFLNEIEKFYFSPSPIGIEITGFDNITGDISVTIEMFDPDYSIDNAFIRFVLIEDDVTAEYTHLTRDIVNYNFSLGGQHATIDQTTQFEIIPEVDTDNVHAVVFVQLQDKQVLNATSSYPAPDYEVRAIVPFDFTTFGPSTGTYEEDYFTVLNTGMEETFNVSIVLDEAPEGTFVTFCNESGECFPSETDVTLSNEGYENFHANIILGGSGMIKYHFEIDSDNIDPTLIPFTYITDDTEVLIVDDDGGETYEDYFSAALADQGFSYGVWDISKNKLNESVMENIDNLVWNVGWSFPSLDAEDRIFLTDFIEAGKNVFFSGQDIGWDLNESDDNTDVSFYNNYLHAVYVADDMNQYDLTGLEDDPLWDGVTLHIEGGDGADNQLYPSRISAFDAAATEILFYNFGGAGAVQAVHPGSEAKIVYFAFGYEAIDNPDDRNLVMSNVMTWFGATSVPDEQILPEKPLILYNYPNPFSSSTTIFYNLTAENSQNAEISIYNVKGQKVRTFTEQQISRSSDQQITWNGRDNNDKPLASGLYFYRLSIDNYSMTKKMILTK